MKKDLFADHQQVAQIAPKYFFRNNYWSMIVLFPETDRECGRVSDKPAWQRCRRRRLCTKMKHLVGTQICTTSTDQR
jgi:hypothetical protein